MHFDDYQRLRTATHESGHAVAAWFNGIEGVAFNDGGTSKLACGMFITAGEKLSTPIVRVSGFVAECIFDPVGHSMEHEAIVGRWKSGDLESKRVASMSTEERLDDLSKSSLEFARNDYTPALVPSCSPSISDLSGIPEDWPSRERLVAESCDLLWEVAPAFRWFRRGLFEFGTLDNRCLRRFNSAAFGDAHLIEGLI